MGISSSHGHRRIFLKNLLSFFLLWLLFVPMMVAAEAPPSKIIVTENIPWANCNSVSGSAGSPATTATRQYSCEIKGWFASVMNMVQEIIKYATYITALLAVLMIVYAGIMYSMQGISDAQKGESKKLIMKVIYGTIFLFLIGTILKFIAPWIYK